MVKGSEVCVLMTKKLNTLGVTVQSVSDRAKIDSAIKRLLANKSILAYILKYTVEEFGTLERKEIEELIENPSVSSVPVAPGSTNDLVTGLPQEIKEPAEGVTTYDIRFFARSPRGDTPAEYTLIINVEAQSGSRKKSYDYETRGIVYCSRMISEQLGRNVTHSHYENVQKVYSIWIIMDDTQEAANTISECGITNRTVAGKYDNDPRVDLMRVVVIRLPKDREAGKAKNPATKLTEMLSTLLSQIITPEKKLDDLENKFDIPITEEIREEANDMCNYSDSLVYTTQEQVAIRMLKQGKYSDEDIAYSSGLELEDVEDLKDELKKEDTVMA